MVSLAMKLVFSLALDFQVSEKNYFCKIKTLLSSLNSKHLTASDFEVWKFMKRREKFIYGKVLCVLFR